ncbi:hypothetical protein KY290_017763 [Solanum tuberosum]|uniref:Uncharacterized protein n=1 Tax=Solanum tuberosum TaxID=4113 RepID=A0ABQ7VC85_SOLTU|nr:hypothetical protein KY290_017763 [Solanum tuberosum]
MQSEIWRLKDFYLQSCGTEEVSMSCVARLKEQSQLLTPRSLNGNFYKLNTDGCSKGNPGEAPGGGVLRD